MAKSANESDSESQSSLEPTVPPIYGIFLLKNLAIIYFKIFVS